MRVRLLDKYKKTAQKIGRLIKYLVISVFS